MRCLINFSCFFINNNCVEYLKEISVIKSKLKHCESQLAQAHKDNAGLARKFDELVSYLIVDLIAN